LAEANTYVTTGKRKTAIARVRLTLGTGAITVNGKPADDYFSREVHRIIIREPLEAIDSLNRFDITASIDGGGHAGQAGALRHGISRAIEKFDPTQRTTLKPRGFLTRDARKKERKKYGQRGARARFQFSKR
jgi:small subunit ribosomal protein S9